MSDDDSGVEEMLCIERAYSDYEDARQRLITLAPCTNCCPPIFPCHPGERIRYGNIVRCQKCGGDGFLINWEDDDEDDA